MSDKMKTTFLIGFDRNLERRLDGSGSDNKVVVTIPDGTSNREASSLLRTLARALEDSSNAR